VLNPRRAAGFNLIELMITVAVLATVIAVGVPNFIQFLQNTQIRTAAESTMAGIQFARAEALKRNMQVRLTLVDDVISGCSKQADGGSWVVSLDFIDGNCNEAPSETASPRILQTRSAKEGSPNAAFVATGGAGDNHTLIFNGLGRMVSTNTDQFQRIDISNPTGGTCEHEGTTGTMRCLRIVVTPGGDARMCDPKVTDTSDPRAC
jgi:type IV fimbrial biogenesis protein FimT